MSVPLGNCGHGWCTHLRSIVILVKWNWFHRNYDRAYRKSRQGLKGVYGQAPRCESSMGLGQSIHSHSAGKVRNRSHMPLLEHHSCDLNPHVSLTGLAHCQSLQRATVLQLLLNLPWFIGNALLQCRRHFSHPSSWILHSTEREPPGSEGQVPVTL